MARDYAHVRVSIWGDDDFRRLTPLAQHLYFVLFTSAQLNHCGVTDWRPPRIAPVAAGLTPAGVMESADELHSRLYVIPDEDTEEILVRSFIRHDELLKNPKMAIAMVRAYAGIASSTLRGVVVHEVRRLYQDFPEYTSWTSKISADALRELLDRPAIDPAGLPMRTPIGRGS
jgi:hypothetical protein